MFSIIVLLSLCTRLKVNYTLDREKFAMTQFGVANDREFLEKTVPRIATTFMEQLNSVSYSIPMHFKKI